MSKYTIDDVKNYIHDITDGKCEVTSDKYINSTTLLNIKCGCGNIFHKDFAHIKRKRNVQLQCEECLKNELSKKFRQDINNVIKYIDSTGCEYISGEYINSNSLLTIRCRCGNIFNKSFNKFKSGQDRCPDCGKELNSNPE